MTDIKELAWKVMKEMEEEGFVVEYHYTFATRLIAAYLAEQEPRGWWNPKYPTLPIQLTKPHAGGGWEPFFTAPPLPEPAPRYPYRPAVSAASSSEEVREIVSGLWAMIETINQGHHAADHHDAITATQAADLIEHLAARVPDGCVVVPRRATERMRQAAICYLDDEMYLVDGLWRELVAAGEVDISLSSSIRPEIDVRCLRITED